MALRNGKPGARKGGGHYLVFQGKAISQKRLLLYRKPLFSPSKQSYLLKKVFILDMLLSWRYYEETEQYLA